ncbi:MAG: CapA family protein, partial [Pseudomonadota bacterium]
MIKVGGISKGAGMVLLSLLFLQPDTPAFGSEDLIEIVVVGDTGFNAGGAKVSAQGGYKHGRRVFIDDAIAGIRHELPANISLANLETAVTANNAIGGTAKRFSFRTHPDAIKGFLAAGLNAFSLANNHALDYRQAGAGDTLRHLNDLRSEGLLAFPGLGRSRADAAAPHMVDVHGTAVALSSIGIGGWGISAPQGKAGMLQYPDDFDFVQSALRETPADIRILSVHYGKEFQPETPRATRRQFRQVIGGDGFTLIAGHHKHVANGIELIETGSGHSGLIFYGLGNFLHLGMQNMGRHDLCHDFGLLGRITLKKQDNGSLTLVSVRVVPLTDMHIATKPLPPETATTRIHVVNHLSAQLTDTDAGALGLAFTPQPDGSGLWCNSADNSGHCDAGDPAPTPSKALANGITKACSR